MPAGNGFVGGNNDIHDRHNIPKGIIRQLEKQKFGKRLFL